MRYSSVIDNITAKEWGLSVELAYIFDWVFTLPSWADSVTHQDGIFYFASRHKAIEELSLVSDRPDTIYRYYKKLEGFELIVLRKINGRDYIKLTEKAKAWGRLNELGKNSELTANSEKIPTELGKNSEFNSEKIPTNKNIIIYNNTTDKNMSNLVIDIISEIRKLKLPDSYKLKSNDSREKMVLARAKEFQKTWPGRDFLAACRFAFQFKADEWFGSDMWKYFMPETLLAAKNFTKYLEEALAAKQNPTPDKQSKEQKIVYKKPKMLGDE